MAGDLDAMCAEYVYVQDGGGLQDIEELAQFPRAEL